MVYNSNPAMLLSNFKDLKTLEKVLGYLKRKIPNNEHFLLLGYTNELFFADKSKTPSRYEFNSLVQKITKKYKVDVKVGSTGQIYDYLRQRIKSQLI